MEQVMKTVVVRKTPAISTLQNLAALALALLIDFTDVVPGELLFLIGLDFPVWLAYDAAITTVEAAYLSYLGVPAVKWLAIGGTDLIPFIDVIPWCTLAVLDKRFNVKLPLVTRLFNY